MGEPDSVSPISSVRKVATISGLGAFVWIAPTCIITCANCCLVSYTPNHGRMLAWPISLALVAYLVRVLFCLLDHHQAKANSLCCSISGANKDDMHRNHQFCTCMHRLDSPKVLCN